VVGLLYLSRAERAGGAPFGLADLNLLSSLAGQIAIALENTRLLGQVRAGREQMRRLAGQIVSAQEEERHRLSRELHDDAGQSLTALKIGLELIQADLPPELGLLCQRLGQAIDTTDTIIERIRLLAQNLRPPSLDSVGLSPTLESLCYDFAENTRLSVDYVGLNLPMLPGTVSICLYRLLQEALTNVAKHARANRVQVALRNDAQEICLSVQDDGQGFDEQSMLSRGIGLLGMRERLALLGGWLEIESYPGQGTRLVAHIPWGEVQPA
jgi:signal transduction histidine kinase